MQKNIYICELTRKRTIHASINLKFDMRKYNTFRISCIALLWIFLCILLIRGRGIDGQVLFAIIASGIIVFVPLYKRWKQEGQNK